MMFYLSFATEDTFLGAAVVEATAPHDAVKEAWRRGINPGGQVMILEVSDEDGPCPFPLNTLLSRADMERLDGPVTRHGDIPLDVREHLEREVLHREGQP